MKWFVPINKEVESGDVMKQQSAVFMGNGSCQRTNFILFFNKIMGTADSSNCWLSAAQYPDLRKKNIQNQYGCIINGLKIANGKILKQFCYKGFINE